MIVFVAMISALAAGAGDASSCRCQALAVCAGGGCTDLGPAQLMEAASKAPEIAIARAGLTAALARASGAGVLPNPELSVELEDSGLSRPWVSGSQTTFGVSQALPLGGRRAAARDQAGLGATLAEANLSRTAAGVKAGAVLLFRETLASAERLGLLEEALAEAGQEMSRVRQRQQTGAQAGHETLVWEAELASLCGRVMDECTAYEDGLARLGLLAGAEDWRQLRPVGAETPVSSGAETITPQKLEQAPELEAARLGTQQAEATLRLEEAVAVPDLELGAGFRGFDGFDGQTLVFSVAVPLPLFDRNQAAVGEAAAGVRAAEAEKKRVLLELRQRAEALARSEASIQARLERLERETIPTMQRLVEALKARQASVGGELAALMDARGRLLEAGLERVALKTGLLRVRLELRLLAGTEVDHE